MVRLSGLRLAGECLVRTLICSSLYFVQVDEAALDVVLVIVQFLHALDTSIMAVCAEVRLVDPEMHYFHDPLDHRLPPQDAAIGVNRESLGLGIKHNSATRVFLILRVR